MTESKLYNIARGGLRFFIKGEVGSRRLQPAWVGHKKMGKLRKIKAPPLVGLFDFRTK